MPKKELHVRPIMVKIDDISTADEEFVPCGLKGKVVEVRSCLGGAISGADAALTFKISGTAITGGALTVANASSAAGDIDSAVPTGANFVTEDDHLSVETDGASTGTEPVWCQFWIADAG